MQDRLLTVDQQGMTRIVPALKTNHSRRPVRQQIDDLAFTLVTPLGADNNDALAHTTRT